MKIFTYGALFLMMLVSVHGIAMADEEDANQPAVNYTQRNSPNGGWDYEYLEVDISASPQVVQVGDQTRVSWDSVFGSPYATPSPRAYTTLEYGPECQITKTSASGGTTSIGSSVKGSFYDTVTGTSPITYRIRCRANIERSGCADHLSAPARTDNGPDNVCRHMEVVGDNSDHGAGWFYRTVTVTPSYPDKPVVASCTVSPATAAPNTEVTWSATGTGGETYKQLPDTYTWTSSSKRCGGYVESCGSGTYAGGSCSAGSSVCSPDYDYSCSGDAASAILAIPVGGISNYTEYSCTPSTAYGYNNSQYTFSWTGTDGLSGVTSMVTKMYTTPGTKQATVTVTADSGQASKTCEMTVDGALASQPNLTASSISPTSAVAGTPVTLSATITNGGTAPTGSAFTDLFQRATNAGGSNATDIGTYANAALGNGNSTTATRSYTFSSAGTYYVRACADKGSAGDAGVVSESDESDNCGSWTAITVSSTPSAPPTCSLSSSGSSVPTTLTWSSTNATSCTGGGFSTGGATSGSASVSDAGAYTLSCTGSGGSCSASATVSSGTCAGPATLSIAAAPTRVRAGQTATVTWSASNVPGQNPSCTVSGPGISQTIPAGGVPTCAIPNGTATPTITTQSTYTITCGSVSQSVTVNVIPIFDEF